MNQLSKLLERAFENIGKKNCYSSGPWAVAFEDRPFETLFWVYYNRIPVLEGSTLPSLFSLCASEDIYPHDKLVDAVFSALPGYILSGESFSNYINGPFKRKHLSLAASLMEDILNQIDQKHNLTSFGDPQAFISLDNGRVFEATLEMNGLPEEEYFYSIQVHCNEAEYDSGMCESTVGVIGQMCSMGVSNDDLMEVVLLAIFCNESDPVSKEHFPKKEVKRSLKSSISNLIHCAARKGNESYINSEDKLRNPTIER